MEKQYSVKFFSSFIESLQNICQEHLTFNQVVEVSGYVSVEIDNARKERYVLSELLQSCGNVISESYCTKAYNNLPVALREKTRTEPPAKPLVENKDNKENSTKKSEPSKADSETLCVSKLPKPKQRKSNSVPSNSSIRFNKLKDPDVKNFLSSCDCVKVSRESVIDCAEKQRSSNGIESRSSSFLVSAAKLCSTNAGDQPAPDQESFQEFVSSVIDSLNSPKQDHSPHSSSENSLGVEDEGVYLDPSKPSKNSETFTSRSSTKELPGQSNLPSQSADPSQKSPSTKPVFCLSNLFRLKPKSKHSEARASTAKKCSNTTSFDTKQESQNLNISSLRHLVSKSYEDMSELQQRKTGMESDIPPGEAYIEVFDEEEDGEIISLDDVTGEAEVEKVSIPSETPVSPTGVEVPCTVSSSQALETGSISTVTSVDDVDSSQLAISEESDQAGQKILNSPIIIDPDSDEEGDEKDAFCVGDDQPYSNVEIRKLDTFKDYVKFAVKRFQAFTTEKGLNEPIFQIPPNKLDPLLAEFYVTVRNRRGEEFGISTLKSIQSYLELYLRENGYPVSITRDEEFSNCRSVLQTKIHQLREIHMKSLPSQSIGPALLTRRDVEKLFRTHYLGDNTAQSLTNSMWLMNAVLFKLDQNIVHSALKWGDVILKVDEYQNEYLELASSNIFRPDSANCKVYPNNANPERCFLRLYKMFERMRPPNTLDEDSPFYLTVDHQLNLLKSEKMDSSTISVILRNMLLHVGIQPDKQVVDYDIL